MSSHRIDASGQRGLSLNMNDPASTAAQVTAKAGDDVAVNLGNFREIRISLPARPRIERRLITRSRMQTVDGTIRPDLPSEPVVEERLFLVLVGSASIFGRTSYLEPPDGEAASEGMPHTTLFVKRHGETPHYYEEGELANEIELAEFLPWTEPASGSE